MRRIALVALAMSLTTMAGCSSLDSTGPYRSVAGTYSLVRINGSLLPYTFSSGATLFNDDLTLYDNGEYVDDSEFDRGGRSQQFGVYSNTNGSLYFDPDDTGIAPYQGSVTGRVLTVIANGYTQTFERR